jgi:2-keto-4-pentenoate hydratase
MHDRIEEAATLIATAWRTHVRLAGLPPSAAPTSIEEAHAIQDAVAAKLGQSAGGWKAGVTQPIRGMVLASRLLPGPARISATLMRRRVVEGEVAFVFDADMPPSPHDYARDAVAEHVTACAAIEIVDSRYEDMTKVSELDRIADLFGNSALVYGPPAPDWRSLDLAKIHVRLMFDGEAIVDRAGGHPSGDPLNACVLLVNDLRRSTGVRRGQIVTTGTYTGAPVLAIGSTATVAFDGLGSTAVTFTE